MLDARDHSLKIIAGEFNPQALDRGIPKMNTRGQILIETFAELKSYLPMLDAPPPPPLYHTNSLLDTMREMFGNVIYSRLLPFFELARGLPERRLFESHFSERLL